MSKVTPVNNGDTGFLTRSNYNEAIKDVEVDGITVTGDGIDTPLAVDSANLDSTVIPFNSTTAKITETEVATAINELGANLSQTVKVVNFEADFPVQDATTITLEAGIHYQIGNTFNTNKRFICESGSSMSGNVSFGTGVNYLGTESMFTCINGLFQVRDLRISASAGRVFTHQGDGTFNPFHTFLVQDCLVLDCDTVGTVSGVGLFVFRQTSVLNCSGDFGIQVSGNNANFTIENYVCFGLTNAAAIDLTTSVNNDLVIDRLVAQGGVGSIGLLGAPNSANLPPTVKGILVDSNLVDVETPYSGVSSTDIRWIFSDNSGDVEVSHISANPYLSTSISVSIPSANTFILVNQSSWITPIAEKLSVDTDGIITNISEQTIVVPVNGYITMEAQGGGSDYIVARLAKNLDPNGTEAIATENGTENGQPTSVPLVGLFTLDPLDTISMWVANTDDNSDIAVINAKLLIHMNA